MNKQYDVLIIGGGPAGLSAALTLARGLRTVLIFDDQKPRNAPAAHMQNFPSHDGLPPQDFRNLVLSDLREYPTVQFKNQQVDELSQSGNGFRIGSNGDEYFGRKVLLAHGMRDVLLPLAGFRELWGKAIFQCPYCHGYEIKNSQIALLGGGPMVKHLLPILRGLTDDLVLFTNGEETADRETIERNGIRIYEEKITGLLREGETMTGVSLASGVIVKRSYLFLRVPQVFSTDIAVSLGCGVTESGFYAVDELGKTTVKGVFAAGDIASMKQSVLGACAAGQTAGAGINHELLSEDFFRP